MDGFVGEGEDKACEVYVEEVLLDLVINKHSEIVQRYVNSLPVVDKKSKSDFFDQRTAGVARTLADPSRSKDTGPCPEPLPIYGHSFVPVAACFWPQFYAQPIACRLLSKKDSDLDLCRYR